MSYILSLNIGAIVLFSLIMLLYFKVAERYQIIDRPNERSSHTIPTIRGGGVIFVFAVLIYAILQAFQPIYFLIGFFAIAAISFIDDIKSLPNRLRLLIHFLAILLLIYQITAGNLPWWAWGICVVLAIGIVNAYNFMDGINGITGLYSLVTLGTLLYLQQIGTLTINIELILLPIISLLVFNFFNVRKKARCFAGDVGSVALAFLVIFLIGKIFLKHTAYTCINSWQMREIYHMSWSRLFMLLSN